MDDLTGQNIKGYELKERIGAGGFGAVYRAYQTTVGREVAIKIILPGFANRPDFIRRFESEAQLIARLEHLHIIPLYDFWRDPTGAYLVMRLFRGGSLRDALQEGAFKLESAARLLDQITSALSLAHRNDIIHRDIKPGNILLDEDGNAYLADFGIAKVLGELPGDLTQGGLVGSLDYISPEQARSEPLTPRTDIYSLGVILYELLTGEHPFPNSTSVERLYKHLNDPLPKITALNGVGDAVNDVIQKATAKNPAKRYTDAFELAAAFRGAAHLSWTGAGESLVEQLTFREQEVLRLIVEGKSNHEIAQILVITVGTVKWYVNQIFAKLGVRNRVQAIVRARELHLVVPGSISEEQPRNVSEAASGAVISVSLPEPINPYKGLRAFQTTDHRHFFGREGLVERLTVRMQETDTESTNRFLAVVGPSGSGKSSVVKAGLIPALWRGDLPGSEHWFVVEMLPGSHPLDELEVALIKVAANQSSNLHDQLARDGRGLLRVAQLILPEDGSELVIVIDQFEEVFTLLEDETARVHFLDLLTTAVADPRSRVRVIITLRADFYDRPLHYSEFGELLRTRMETILPLSAEGLSRAISHPAKLVGVTFEDGLIPTIIEEIDYQSSALPLLQYALTELFDRREGRLLTRKAFQDMGGTVGALAKRADEIYENLTPDGQEAARQMFLRLVTLGEGVEDTRRRVARSELLAISPPSLSNGEEPGVGSEDLLDELIDTYTSYRLLSLDNDPITRSPTVEVAHEAILREWERLRGWLDESRADVRLQRVLGNVTAEWLNAGRDASFLLHGARLTQFESWAKGTDLALTAAERSFLEASLIARGEQETAEAVRQEREHALEQRSRNVLRALVGVFAVATVIALFLSIFAFNQRGIAQDQADLASARELALAANLNLEMDPERSIMLSLQSLATIYTTQGEEALRKGIHASRMIALFYGLTENVGSVAYSPDGTRVATSSSDGTVKVWDPTDGKEILSLIGTSVAFSPNGDRLATGSEDGTVWIWDASTGDKLLTLTGHTAWFNQILFSPNGKQLATASDDDTVKVWDLTTGEILSTLDVIGDFFPGNGVAFTPDGMKIVAASYLGPAKIWNISTGEELTTFSAYPPLAISPDGSLLATGDVGFGVLVWDLRALLQDRETQPLYTLTGHAGFVPDIAFNGDGSILATGSVDTTAKVWALSPDGGENILTLSGHEKAIHSVDLSPSGDQLVTASEDGTARVWDISLTGNREVQTLAGQSDSFRRIEYSPDGTLLAAATGNGGAAVVWDTVTGEPVFILANPSGSVWDVTFNPDGTRLATAGEDNIVRIWDAATGQELFALTGHEEAGPIGGVYPGIVAVDYSSDGKLLATGGADGTARIWDGETGKSLRVFLVHPNGNGVTNVVFSPDSAWLATATDASNAPNALVKIWDVASGQELQTLIGFNNRVWGLAFNLNGTRLVTTGEAVIIWDTDTGEEVSVLSGFTGTVSEVIFSPDGKQLVTSGVDLPKIWDFATGRQLLTLPGHMGLVSGLASNPYGTHLATASNDGTIRIYVLDLDALITLAKSRLTRWFTLEECQQFLHTDTCPPDPRP